MLPDPQFTMLRNEIRLFQGAEFATGEFHFSEIFLCSLAQSNKYRLIKFWYGMCVSSESALKYAITSDSKRIVTAFLSRLT